MVSPIKEITTGLSPIMLFRGLKERPFAFFLDSSLADGTLGRWSFLGADPFLVFKSKRRRISLEWKDGKAEVFEDNPFSVLKEIFLRFKTSAIHPTVPLLSGGVGYFSYDLKDFIEELPDLATDDLGLPECIIGFYDSLLAYDNAKGRCYATGPRAEEMMRGAKALRFRMNEWRGDADGEAARAGIGARSNFTKRSYEKTIERAKEYIKRGDIYQVNLSQRFDTDFRGDPFELYVNLRRISPSPFSSFLDFGEVTIASSSPERFLRVRGDHIETRPIKGTRPRGRSPEEDRALERELVKSSKDMAEHVMIVDLERNDLGRICRYNTVKPTEFAIVERYSTVFHLVSTISGALRQGVTPVDCLAATFPGGSITGAPKIRSMEIIEELEPVKRSIYTGAIGYIDFSGAMDTSIVIRTFIMKGHKAYFQVGGGIVADSDPEAEYRETLDKARGLMDSLVACRAHTHTEKVAL